LSYAQCRVAIPNTYGVVQGHWNNSGNESYAINDWGISFARALSPFFSMGIKGRYKQEKIGYDKQSAVMVDVGLRYQITAQLDAASAISNPFRDSLESTAFHYGEGQRISTVFKYKLQKMTLNIKLGQTLFYDNTQVKSGSVEGHKSTEVKLVLKWIL
jgi:hypothetical protein